VIGKEVEVLLLQQKSFNPEDAFRISLFDDGSAFFSEYIIGKEDAGDERCCRENKIAGEMATKWSLEQSIKNVIPLWPKLFDPG
jgi:hypothetical protein